MKMLSVLLVGLSVATDALRAGVSWSASTSPQVRHGAVCSLRAAVEGDSRSRIVLESDAAVGRYICERVEAIAMAAITETGGFSMSIGSGTTVKPLIGLTGTDIDFSKVHVFFGNERVSGDTAYKCHDTAEFLDVCGIPRQQVHKVPWGGGAGGAAGAALEYEELIRSMPPAVVGECARSGLPALDLVLLGSGADGHCASLYPHSPQVLVSPSSRLVVEAAGKGGTTFTLDLIRSARHVIISAPKPAQKEMVKMALAREDAAGNAGCPAGMISAGAGTSVEWLLSPESAALLPDAGTA